METSQEVSNDSQSPDNRGHFWLNKDRKTHTQRPVAGVSLSSSIVLVYLGRILDEGQTHSSEHITHFQETTFTPVEPAPRLQCNALSAVTTFRRLPDSELHP